MKTITLTLSLLFLPWLSHGQLLFHEGFEIELPEGQTTLGNLNGWQESWNSERDSQAMVPEYNMHWESPFPPRGRNIQISGTREGAFKQLPEALNGQTVYFSFLFRFFQKEGGLGQFRIRSDQGHVLGAGFQEGRFQVQAIGETATWGNVRDRENYMIIGKITINEDGSEVNISANAYTTRASIPLEAPEEWSGETGHKGPARRWNGVECFAASQNVAFDDLRIGLTWRDVAGTRR
ncbi:MAG: hypothetical protein JJU29_04225 [Verrucomicrobia bacterium]|nr:hypothetical protein [Verrucomicrobiota bacterium]MCH8513908.1 hypothetical protein [Kiritimatiellia bacterium]